MRAAASTLLTVLLLGCDSQPASPTAEDVTSDAATVGQLECLTNEVEEGDIDYIADAPGHDGDAEAVVREWLADSLEPSDQVAVAPPAIRRPSAAEAVLVMRDDATIAVVQIAEATDGGLLVSGYEGCPGAIRFP